MEDLFRSYWWLLFPLGWFVASGFSSFLNYRRQKETLKLIKAYADKGQEPPEALMRILDRPIDAETESRTYPSDAGPDRSWFNIVLFALLAAAFGYASYIDVYGVGEALMIAAFVLGALAVASLVQALIRAGRKG